MAKLISVIANKDEYMEDGSQFCTKGRDYLVIDSQYDDTDFCIIDDTNNEHYFYFNDCSCFDLKYEE